MRRDEAAPPPPPPARARGSRFLNWLAGDRRGFDRTLFLIAALIVPGSLSNPVWQSLLALGWILLIVEMVRRRAWLVRAPRPWLVVWGLFIAWNLLAAALSPDPGPALLDAKKLANLLAIFLFATAFRTAGDYLRVLRVAATVFCAGSVIGLVQYWETADPVGSRIHGTLSHHMTFTGMLLIVACMVLPLLRARPRGAELLWWAYVLLATAAILASLTRSAWLATVPALVVCLFFLRRRWLLALPVVLAALFLAVPQVRTRTLSIVDTRGDYSNVRRLGMYPTGLHMTLAHPWLGLGGRRQVRLRYPDFESHPPELPPTVPGGPPPEPAETPLHLHNNALQIAAESGLPALLLWVAALGIYLRDTLRALRGGPARRAEERYRLLVGSLAAVAAFLTMGMLEYNFGDSEVAVLFFLVLSVPVVLGREAPPPLDAGTP